jgi:hypothetical protein
MPKKGTFLKSFDEHPFAFCWSSKNEMQPNEISINSSDSIIMNCHKCDHEYETKPINLTGQSNGCQYCYGVMFCEKDCERCFKKSFASNPRSLMWSDKNSIKPNQVSLSSNKKIIFQCNKCPHEFESSLAGMKEKHGCVYCAYLKLCDNEECKYCFENSFASHPIANQWSEKNEVKPRQIFKSTKNKYLFNCDTCHHEYLKSPGTIHEGNGCQYCTNCILCDDETCVICFNKSFASNREKAQYWSPLNEKKARDVFKSDNKKYWFKCKECHHTFDIGLNHVTDGKWCSYCSHGRLCEDDSCRFCFENSFASHKRSKSWSSKNKLKPRDVFLTTHLKFIFNCDMCNHEFTTQLSCISRGDWCPLCKNKTEKILFNEMKIIYSDLKTQVRYDWCRNPETNFTLPFDFVLEERKIIIELDGIQHFKQVLNWGTPEETYKRDVYKMKLANQQGYSMIRIFQEDVYSDKIDWKTLLCESIKTICENGDIENHFISFDEDLYKDHIKMDALP